MPDSEFEIEKLVTLETFSSPWEAQLARACLEAEGIEAVVADEHFFRLYGALSNTLGGVRLQVRPEHAGRAAELLRNRRPIFYVVSDEDAGPPLVEEEGEPESLAGPLTTPLVTPLVTIGRFYSPWEAHLARTLLESEGIAACVCEERLPSVSLLTGAPTALSRLEVHSHDAERALEILATVEELDEAPASE
jgi:hypothetical protein